MRRLPHRALFEARLFPQDLIGPPEKVNFWALFFREMRDSEPQFRRKLSARAEAAIETIFARLFYEVGQRFLEPFRRTFAPIIDGGDADIAIIGGEGAKVFPNLPVLS